MSNHQSQVIRIANKVKLLLKNQEQLRRENERLRAAVATSENEVQALKETIAQMEEKIAVMKASAGKMEGKAKQEFEKKIGQYIKDLDKVIAHINV